MEENNQNVSPEELKRREETFENLKKFFESDMRIKENLLKIAPNELDDFNEESRIKYTDKLYKQLKEFEAEFTEIAQNFNLGLGIDKAINEYFTKVREAFLIGKYEQGAIQDLYRTQFSNMNKKLIEAVKDNCAGWYTEERRNLEQLINKTGSINELLHVMHSYITNNEQILEAMPVVDVKKNKYNETIILYGEETELSRKLFDDFPIEIDNTNIISMKNKILMMIRGSGHALSMDIDISNENDILVKYFVPKLCNRDMIEKLPGINTSSISDSGANGRFETSKEEMSNVLIDFIGRVPTDGDIPKDNPEREKEKISTHLFGAEDVKEIAMETNENGRRMGALAYLQTKLKEYKDKIIGKITGEKLGDRGDAEDGTTRN